ncbi:hypothetical protein BTZ20_2560 [Rhodococcus sp. MTM3W5.2]|nr:hypothetical protein BTZ20_2560 [Rhodococcus sp. MTM3W5.2]
MPRAAGAVAVDRARTLAGGHFIGIMGICQPICCIQDMNMSIISCHIM